MGIVKAKANTAVLGIGVLLMEAVKVETEATADARVCQDYVLSSLWRIATWD
jgi:hypothetical protein